MVFLNEIIQLLGKNKSFKENVFDFKRGLYSATQNLFDLITFFSLLLLKLKEHNPFKI